MALANPRQIQTSPVTIHPSSMPILDHQNALLSANSSVPLSANLLLPGQFILNQIHPTNFNLIPNNQNDPNSQQIHFKMEFNENLDEPAILQSQQFCIDMKEQSNLATIASLASASHSTQQFLDRTILELLLAKSNALSLLSQSLLLPNFVPFLPTSTAPTLQNTFTPIPLRMDSILPGNMEHHANEIVGGNEQKISHQLDTQMNSLSRNKLGRSYNPGRPLGMLDRQKILELYQKGLKISHIAKVIGVTHSCVSKIMTRYRRTGSIHPRSAQLSLLSRRQSSTNPSNCLILPNAPKIPTIQFSCWQQCLNKEKDEIGSALKCSFPSAFQRICGVSSDEKEANMGRSISMEDGQQQEQKKEQKPYLVERLLF